LNLKTSASLAYRILRIYNPYGANSGCYNSARVSFTEGWFSQGFTNVAFPTTVFYSCVEPEQALIWSVLHLPRNVIIHMSEYCLTLRRLYCIQFKPLDFHCTMRRFHMLYNITLLCYYSINALSTVSVIYTALNKMLWFISNFLSCYT
jgi:hypothetical protein